MTARWARGLLRLWIASAVIWVGVVVFVGLHDLGIPSISEPCDLPYKFKVDRTVKALAPPVGAQCEAIWREELTNLAEWALIPLACSLVIVLVLVWAMRGLRT